MQVNLGGIYAPLESILERNVTINKENDKSSLALFLECCRCRVNNKAY